MNPFARFQYKHIIIPALNARGADLGCGDMGSRVYINQNLLLIERIKNGVIAGVNAPQWIVTGVFINPHP